MGLFGSPVGHSASPEMYNFCFQHDGLDYAYLAFDVKAEDMPETINTIRLLKMRGGNFTMPCKNIAAKLMDRLSPAAELIGACNAFVNEEGVLTGYITDGIGFVKNLKEHGIEVKGKKVLVPESPSLNPAGNSSSWDHLKFAGFPDWILPFLFIAAHDSFS